MVKNWEKQLDKYSNIWWLKEIIQDINSNNYSKYDIKKLLWYKNLYRLRKWKIRIIFQVKNKSTNIINIDTRWNIYKSI